MGSTQESLSYRGVDKITQTTTQSSTFYNSEGKQLYTTTMSQSVSVTVDEAGKASSPLLTTSGATVSTSAGGGTSSDGVKSNISLNATSEAFRSLVSEVSEYKKDNNGVSPIQAQAVANGIANDKIQMLGNAEALIGAGSTIAGATGIIPEPTSKVATAVGIGIAAIGVFTQFTSFETDPNKITNRYTTSSTQSQSSEGYELKPPKIN